MKLSCKTDDPALHNPWIIGGFAYEVPADEIPRLTIAENTFAPVAVPAVPRSILSMSSFISVEE
jgi:hypothetical protein